MAPPTTAPTKAPTDAPVAPTTAAPTTAPTKVPTPPPPRAPQQPTPPVPDPNVVKAERTKAQVEFEESFADFHKNHFLSKVLASNKSAATQRTEQGAVDKLIKSAVKLNDTNIGEGVWALLIVSLREQLSLRDRANELEYTLYKTMKEFQDLQKELGIENDQQKK